MVETWKPSKHANWAELQERKGLPSYIHYWVGALHALIKIYRNMVIRFKRYLPATTMATSRLVRFLVLLCITSDCSSAGRKDYRVYAKITKRKFLLL